MHINIANALLQWTKQALFGTRLEVEQTLFTRTVDGVTNMVSDYIEEYINRQLPIVHVLRLVCLMSTTMSGLTEKMYAFSNVRLFKHMDLNICLHSKICARLGYCASKAKASTTSGFTMHATP